MAQVLDYVGRPGALTIVKAGYVGAVRYCGFPNRAKCTDRGEYEDFSHQGIGMALVYEGGTQDWAGGHAAGRVAGARARADATERIQFPSWRPIYMAIDTQIVGETQHATVMAYLDGAAEELGGALLTGVYGQCSVVQLALEGGHAVYGWQTVAWSKGMRCDIAHLYQRAGYVYPGGFECDVSDVLQVDWGQHNYLPPPDPVAATVEDDMADRELQPTDGKDVSVTLTVPKNATEAVVARGWAGMQVKKLAVMGPTPAVGVNQLLVAVGNPGDGPKQVDPGRPWQVRLPAGGVTLELTYSMDTDPGHHATAVVGFR